MKTKLLLALVINLLSLAVFAQNNTGRTVNGLVKNEKGEELPGITVTEKGTRNSVASSGNGSFTMKVKENATLVFSGVGYEQMEVSVAGNTSLNVVMKEESKALSDVVIVGYGSQKKAKVTGAVATIKMDEVLGERPVSTTATLLQGITPGLQVTISSGKPGDGASLNVRGATGLNTQSNSITSRSPLILVDNTVYDLPLNSIDPNDIESVTVLKDAGSAAIYGSRSAYGVILITTKRGVKNQKPQFNYSNNIIFSTPTNLPRKASPKRSIQALIDGGLTNYTVGQGQDLNRWIQLFDEYAAKPSSFPGGYAIDNNIFYNLKGNDAVGELLGNSAVQMMHNFSVSGGSDKTTYRISLGTTNENGIMVPSAKVDNFKRYNIKSNLTADITNWMNVQFDALYVYSNTTSPGYSDPYTYAVRIPSFLAGDSIPGFAGQIATGKNLVTNSYPTQNRTDQFRMTGRVILKPFKGLTVTGENTFDNFHRNITSYNKNFRLLDPYGWASQPFGNDQFTKNNSAVNYNTVNIFANYVTSLGDHNLGITGGFNQDYRGLEQVIVSKTQIIDPNIPSISTSAGAFDGSDQYTQFAARGFFSRLNYDFKSKYLLEVNARYDGSSRFPEGRRWAFNPSASVGWRLMSEKFMAFAKPVLNEFKFRASYGSVGNQQIADYQFMAIMDPSNPGWLDNGNRVVTLSMPSLISPDFTWEKISTLDFGVSFGLFKNRLTGEFDWYSRDTKGILSRDNTPVPAVLGTNPPLVNSASMNSKGFEAELTWRDKAGKINYYISANVYDFISTVTKVDNPNNLLSQLYVGQQLGQIWGYVSDRLLTTDDFIAGTLSSSLLNGTPKAYVPRYGNQSPNPGDMMYVDMDGNGLINAGKGTLADPGDRRIIGNSSLRYQFGLRGGIGYKNFDFSFVIAGVLKNDQFRSTYLFFPNNFQVYGALYQSQLNYWTPTNTNAYFGRIYTTTPNGQPQTFNEIQQSRYLLNGAYLRVRNLSLRYNLPDSWLKKVNVKRLSVNYSVENPFIIHHMPQGMFPDIANQGGGLGYPLMRKQSIGINLNF